VDVVANQGQPSVIVHDNPTTVILGGGRQGPQGVPGASGGAWLFGAGIPSNSLGSDGQTFYSTDTGGVYQKATGAWVLQGTVTGQNFYFEHVQNTASDTWTINHNLGSRPSVSAYSVGGKEMLGEILHVSANQLNIYFDSPVTGIAVCS
jgi:hypothetical protein